MAQPRTFISFDFDNNKNEKELFAGQSCNSKTPFSIQDWSSKEALPQNEWEKLIADKINKCDLAIILVGKNTSKAIGVVKEISFAVKKGIPFFGVYVGGADQSTLLPSGLARNRTIAWNWEGIAKAIDQCMTQWK
ncbi:MTH538 TIR-like domain [Filimonas lacunae]|uniref:MTH538 TIR-like domain n=1 Tax=Filimonas lacunae TaxID=477680 RepID=A0A1N7NDP5_9BACT|nr:TIR domain-containing protein [Filimonas lacunae]SIS96412.1 MTH538 TIR-like domain [Filimonas lacunae]